MPSEQIKIIISESPNSNNKKLLRYFKDNLNALNAKGYVFEWIVAYKNEKKEYAANGIDKFPALLVNPGKKKIDPNSIIFGTNSIISFLTNNKIGAKSSKKYLLDKGDDFNLDEMMYDILTSEQSDEKDVDGVNNFSENITSLMNKNIEIRKNNVETKTPKPKINNTNRFSRDNNIQKKVEVSALDLLDNADEDNEDNKMLKILFENQQE